jgi:hypothetical protein
MAVELDARTGVAKAKHAKAITILILETSLHPRS